MSDRLVEAAKETAGDAVERGKQVAQDVAETAKESGREQGQELASNPTGTEASLADDRDVAFALHEDRERIGAAAGSNDPDA